MPEGSSQEKTEQATPKRREDARKKGQVAQSREISSTAVLLGGLLILYFSIGNMVGHLSDLMTGIFQNLGEIRISENNFYGFLCQNLFQVMVLTMAPILATIVVVGLGANFFQKGFLFTLEPLAPKISKINPLKGIKKLFSLQSLTELLKSILKLVIVGGIAYLIIKDELSHLLPLMQMEIEEIMAYLGRVSFKISIYICGALIFLSALDYAFQKWDHEKNLKMSRQEIKDEFKQREGDPLVKARIKSLQREMSKKRMMAEIPKADVVITNPTQLAVAVLYDRAKEKAPRVVAKGAGYVAKRIVELAGNYKIVVVENKPLARSLFKLVEIGGFIPENLYQAVAEILAYVYNLKQGSSR